MNYVFCFLLDIYWNILTMHGPINVKSPNNISKWQMGFNSAFKGLRKMKSFYLRIISAFAIAEHHTLEMGTLPQKSFCVLDFCSMKTVINVQRQFGRKF